jgi:hypothetical protein
MLELSLHMASSVRVYVYAWKLGWSTNSNTLKPDRPQHDSLAVYRPSISLHHLRYTVFEFPQIKFWSAFKQVIISFLYFLKIALLKVCDLKLSKMGERLYGLKMYNLSIL